MTTRNADLLGLSPRELQGRLEKLQAQIDAQNRMLFGQKSEKSKGERKPATEKQPQTGHGPTPQKLNEQTVLLELPEDSPLRICPDCQGALAAAPGLTENSEYVDVVERMYTLVKQQRQLYRCGRTDCQGTLVAAPAPARLVKKGQYSTNFAIQVAVDKYGDHSPLERQVVSMKRANLVVTSQTLWDQIDALARALESAYDQLKQLILAGAWLGADETRWKLLAKKGSAGAGPHVVYALSNDRMSWYTIAPGNRTHGGIREVLGDYAGKVMADGWDGYEAGPAQKWILLQCWAHARRKLIESEPAFPEVRELIDQIGELYGIEQRLRESGASVEEKTRVRGREARPVLEAIFKEIDRRIATALPASGLAKALQYIGNRKTELMRYVEDGALPIDNNGTERAQRGIVVGRKNHYGSKSKRGTEVAAILYSLIETAKLNGLNPVEYLRRATEAQLAGLPVPLPLA